MPVIKVARKLKIINQSNPRVSVSPTVEDIISLKVYNNDCSKIWKICAFSIKHIFAMGMQP